MDRKDYIKIIKVPVILLLINAVLAYAFSLLVYKDAGTYEEAKAAFSSATPLVLLLFMFGMSIIFYSGWIAAARIKGTIKDSIFTGLIVGGIQFSLSLFSIALMYSTIPAYRILMSPLAGDAGVVIILIATLFGVPSTFAVFAGVSALGGFAWKKINKK